MPGHAVFITHRTRPGMRDAVRDVWMRMSCVCFSSIPMQRAAAAFLEHPNYAEYLAEVEGLLAGPPEVHAAIPQWSKSPD